MSFRRPTLVSIASTTTTRPQQQSLAKRLLFNSQLDGVLPPILASTNAPPELTNELYDFIALSLRAYVNPWWTKLTRHDRDLLPHISRILIVVIRNIESRLLALDAAPLAFHDLPVIVTQHYRDYRNATAKLSTAYASGGAMPLSHLFHSIQPHMAISPDGALNQEYYRQIIDVILKNSLPPEDYNPEAERFIIRELILKILLVDIIPKITQPWFIYRTILDQLDPLDAQVYTPAPTPSSRSIPLSSFHTLVVIILSALQSFSTACLALMHAYRQTLNTIKLVNSSPSQTPPFEISHPESSDYVSVKSPQRRHSTHVIPIDSSRTISTSSTKSNDPTVAAPPKELSTPLNEHADYTGPPLMMISELFTTHERFAATTLMTACSMASALAMPFLDKLLPHLLANFISPAFILNTTKTAKRTLFPTGYPGPTPPDPTPEEQAEIRAKLIAWRGRGGLAHVLPVLLGKDISHTIETAMEPLSDRSCNVHLTVLLLDRILVVLFPELIGATCKDTESLLPER